MTGTRTFRPGSGSSARRPTSRYALSIDRVLVTIGGSTADLDRLSGATLVVMDLDVTGLKAGRPRVPVDGEPAGRDHARRGQPADRRRSPITVPAALAAAGVAVARAAGG